MNGDDFIAISSRLLLSQIGNPEARFRSAVSRAYYGAFHLALEFLGSVGVVLPKNAECHAEVYRALLNSGDSDGIEAARLLNDLRSVRNEADYKLAATRLTSIENAKSDIEMALKCQKKIAICSAEPKKSKIKSVFSK